MVYGKTKFGIISVCAFFIFGRKKKLAMNAPALRLAFGTSMRSKKYTIPRIEKV